MACIVDDPNGRRRIQFVAAEGSRKSIRLGKVSRRSAEGVLVRVEELLAASIHGQPLSRETSVWLEGIGDRLHDRLARAGLCKGRQVAPIARLDGFISAYIAKRIDLKPGSRAVLEQAHKSLVEHFGADRPMHSITPGDADAWRLAMVAEKLAEATIRKRTQAAKQFARAAVRQRLIAEDPFADLPSGSRANPERMRFIDGNVIAKVIDACPDAQWRLIVALARYAGLRVPSELLALRWEHVDWEHNRLTIPSPKTEHHADKAQRVIPLFPELRPPLLEVFEQAPPGTENVITRYRVGNANLRTQFDRIVRQAGVDPWPKPFHNLRASRETELAERFPLHVVCGWIGNTAKVAARHYLQTTPEHFELAVSQPTGTGIKAAQKAAQQMRAGHRTDAQPELVGSAKPLDLPAHAKKCENLQEVGMGAEGFEPSKA